MLSPHRPQPRAILTVEVRIVQDRPTPVAWKEPHRQWIKHIAFSGLELPEIPTTEGVKEGIVRDQLAKSAMDATESHECWMGVKLSVGEGVTAFAHIGDDFLLEFVWEGEERWDLCG